MAPPRKKPVYRTITLERHVAAPRTAAWEAMLTMLAGAGYETEGDPAPHGPGSTLRVRIPGYDLLERTVSLEAPWRRVYQHVEGAPTPFAQGTTAIRDDGESCHVAWALIAEVVDGGDEAAVHAFLDAARPVLERALERIATLAEAEGA
jgi:hypothetical protein